jgi:hypothetical protein
MKPIIFILFLLLTACSHEPSIRHSSEQRPSSLEVDAEKSSAYLIKKKRFLVHIKNSLSQNIEISFTEVKVKNAQGKVIPFQLERVSSGKYYVLPVSQEKELQISIQDKVIGKKFKLNVRKPAKERSSFMVVSSGDHSMLMRLRLADKNNHPVLTNELPEILVEGEAVVEDLKSVENGLWEFTLKYPENNVIIYLSVRCQEVFLEHIYRFQHVEK